jgi:hypothetical protein
MRASSRDAAPSRLSCAQNGVSLWLFELLFLCQDPRTVSTQGKEMALSAKTFRRLRIAQARGSDSVAAQAQVRVFQKQ